MVFVHDGAALVVLSSRRFVLHRSEFVSVTVMYRVANMSYRIVIDSMARGPSWLRAACGFVGLYDFAVEIECSELRI